MPSPAFVTAGPFVEDPTYGWPSSLTLTSSDAPSGVAAGDRLLIVAAAMTLDASGFDHFHVDNAAWTLVHANGAGGGGTPQLAVFTARQSAAAWPVTIESHNSAHSPLANHVGNVYRHWGAFIAVWRPSSTITNVKQGLTSGSVPLPSTNLTTPTFTADGTAIAVGFMAGAFDTVPHTDNGFAEQVHRSATWYAANVKIADKAVTAGASTSGIRWSHPIAGQTGTYQLLTLDQPDPQTRRSGWVTGHLAW